MEDNSGKRSLIVKRDMNCFRDTVGVKNMRRQTEVEDRHE